MVERKISTEQLLFNNQHLIKTSVGDLDVGNLENANTYAVITHLSDLQLQRAYHLYYFDTRIICIHTLNGNATVQLLNQIGDITNNILCMKRAGKPFHDALDIPPALWLGLQHTMGINDSVAYLVTRTGISKSHATNMVLDLREPSYVERFEVINKKQSCTSFLTFVHGSKQLWSITHSSIAGNIKIQSVDLQTYRESVLALLHEVII
jgi:hypothetical protein